MTDEIPQALEITRPHHYNPHRIEKSVKIRFVNKKVFKLGVA